MVFFDQLERESNFDLPVDYCAANIALRLTSGEASLDDALERLGELLPIGNICREATAHRHLSIGAEQAGRRW
jgi:hypothetical protein